MRWAILFACILTGCGDSSSSDGDINKATAITVARQAVERTLRDPSSAEFRNEKIGSYQGKSLVCGEVNSKNAFGGKGGFQRYVSNGAGATVLEEQLPAGEFATVWSGAGC